ncbi:retrovirus-related Pol polyprotein from transposon opus [Trichonephila clavipes]|nr:retrovirus-related Pol polyprotein from transposon opus [Trichonephila clavipes]
MAVSPSDIVKTTFVTKNGTYAFRRMPFGLSGAAPNFQKAIDKILKPVIGKFVSVYMDDVIISSPSFTQHVKHLKEVFRLLHEEEIKTDETKVQAIVEMKPPRNSKEVSKFLGMSQWKCDETEIETGSPDNGSLRDESSGFDRVQRRSNESRDVKKKGSEVKRELEEKGLSFRNNQGEKHTNETHKRRPLIRSIPSSWSEKDRAIKRGKKELLPFKGSHESGSEGPERKVQKGSEHRVNKRALSSNYRTNHNLTKFRKKSRMEETVMPTTSGYNLRPRIGKKKGRV